MGVRDGSAYEIRDEASVLEFFAEAWARATARGADREACAELVGALLARADFWGSEGAGLEPEFGMAVADYLHDICSLGVRPALERLVRATAG